MANPSPVRANALRITRTDACGVPVAEATANSRVTTAGFISVDMSPDVFTSSDVALPAASGEVCVRAKGVPSLLGFDVTLTLCGVNEAILEMLLGATVLQDYAAPVEDVGSVVHAGASTNTVMVEFWPLNGNNDACATGGTNPQRPYLHAILPRTNRWVLGANTTFGDAATTFTLNGYAEPTSAYEPSRAGEEVTAADQAAINNSGIFAIREVTSLPTVVAAGYDP